MVAIADEGVWNVWDSMRGASKEGQGKREKEELDRVGTKKLGLPRLERNPSHRLG